MKTEFDVKDIYAGIFGYKGIPFPLGKLNARIPDKIYTDGLLHHGLHGVSYFMPVWIEGLDLTFGQLPNEPTIQANTKKTIKETPLVGGTRRGTVKELISLDDYNITINGICIADNTNEYPAEQVNAINKLFELDRALFIESEFTTLLGIDKIVLTGLDWREMKGVQHVQGYTITAVSDIDFLLVQN